LRELRVVQALIGPRQLNGRLVGRYLHSSGGRTTFEEHEDGSRLMLT
jgi:hypothetical protein